MSSTLVIKDTYERGERACFSSYHPITLGWKTGELVFWWARCTQSALDELLTDWESDGAQVEIVDRRRKIEV